MEEKKINKRIVFSVVAVLLLIAVVAGATYAFFSAGASSAAQTVTTGTLDLGFTSGNIVRATNIVPIEDSEIATKATELEFSVTNTGSQMMNIEVLLDNIVIDPALKDLDFRWGLYNKNTGNAVSRGVFKDIGTATTMTLLADTLVDPSETKNYILRVYIHNDGAEQNYMQGKNFSAKVTVNGEGVDYTPESCFTVEEGRIIGYTETCPSDIIIPKTIKGEDITEVHLADGPYITSIVFPDSVEIIFLDLYNGGDNIQSITLPESVVEFAISIEDEGGNSNLFMSDNIVYFMAYSMQFGNIVLPTSMSDFYGGVDEVVFHDSGSDWLPYLEFSTINNTQFEIPASITSISPGGLSFLGTDTEIVVRGTITGEENWDCLDYNPDEEVCYEKYTNIVYRP